MPIPFEPWLYYPSLTLERLTFVASLMRDTRDGAVLLHDIEAGDSNWSLGSRVYSRIMAQIERVSLKTSWLRVLPESESLRFTFAVGSIPLKFYRGDADDVPRNCLVRSYIELRQTELAFESDGIEPTSLLRIAIEPDAFGKTSTVTLVEVEESGSPLRVFQIPLDAANVIQMTPKPINLEPPSLEPIDESTEEKESGRAGDQFGSSGARY
jgi:hypothetical protein